MPYKGKCFSTCRKRPEPECKHPVCRYNNGKQYQYCRLNQTYKMNKECEPVLKERIGKHKTRKDNKRIEIENLPLTPEMPGFIHDEELVSQPISPTKEAIAEFRERVKKANATRKIKKFFKKHQNKRRAYFLKAICSDADVCMAFGTEAAKIKKHFEDFNNFDLLSKPAIQIGEVSSNGFVKDLTYEKEGYVANAILKSSASDFADNLLYEGLVGQFLNKKGKQFPCFVETYGIYQYDPKEPAYGDMKTQKTTNPMVLKTGLKKLRDVHPVNLEFACEHSRYMAVLIQHLKDAVPLKTLLTDNIFVSQDLLAVLYQIYMPLAILSKEFTHYDLHYNNVLLYEPVKGHYINYHYHINDKKNGPTVVNFKCKYIAKIIDYGRSFFNDKDNKSFTGSSKGIHTEVCAESQCPYCGLYNGFAYLQDTNKKLLPKSNFISSLISNESHDLRLLYMTYCSLKTTMKSIAAGPGLMDTLEKVVYGKGIKLNEEKKQILKYNPYEWVYYGTQENIKSGLPKKIHNVTDAFNELQSLISNQTYTNKNTMIYTYYEKLGDLHIYEDGRPMRYIPAEI